MGSGAMIYMPSFIKIGSAIQKLTGGYTDRQHVDCINLLFKNKESRLRIYSLHQGLWLKIFIIKKPSRAARKVNLELVACYELLHLAYVKNSSQAGG
jgi:hypothetical protein